MRRVRREFGPCGRLLYAEGRAVGYAQYAPAHFLPNAGSYPAGPVSEDAVLLRDGPEFPLLRLDLKG